MKYAILILFVFLFASATSVQTISPLRARSTNVIVGRFNGYNALDEAKTYIENNFTKGYRVTSSVSTNGHYVSDCEVMIVMEK